MSRDGSSLSPWNRHFELTGRDPSTAPEPLLRRLRERHGSIVNVATTSAFAPGSSIPHMTSKVALIMRRPLA